MKLTQKQQAIIDKITVPLSDAQVELDGGRLFSIPAVAGAGKSLMIVEMARRDAQRNILFLCQSRSIADRARATLPGNITVHTFADAALHFLRLARPEKGKERLVKRHTSQEVLKVAPNGTTLTEAGRALDVLARFYHSAHSHPHDAHLPPGADWTRWPSDAKAALDTARAAWFAQLRPAGKDGLPMSFDALIKWWTLAHAESVHYPELDKRIITAPIADKFDLIIVEEAQLLNVGLLDFLSRQRASIVFFGDGYQSLQAGNSHLQHQQHAIYKRAETLVLNDSVRFGPSVASVCSALAHKAGAERRDWVKGLGRSAVYDDTRRGDWERQQQHYTLLAASPVTLFQEALDATHRGKIVAWINGLASQPITLLRDLVVLGMGQEHAYRAQTARHLIQTPSLRDVPSLGVLLQRFQGQPFHPISQLGQWVYHLAEPNLLRIVDGWRQADEARQAHFRRQLNTPLPRDITLGSVPQAQGHEWPRVALAEDLFPMSVCGHEWIADKRHLRAIHLAYTGASRAQRGLALPSVFFAHLQAHGWELPDDTPEGEIDPVEEGETRQRSQRHTHFGMDRHTRLELTPETRRTIIRPSTSRQSSSRVSGQTRIKERIEQDAKRIGSSGISDLHKALGRTRHRDSTSLTTPEEITHES